MANNYTPMMLYSAQPSVTTAVSAYTAGTSGGASIKKISAHNPTGSNAIITVYFGRSGAAAGTSNQRLKKTLAPDETIEWTDPTHLNQNDILYVQVSTANSLVIDVWGIEVS